MLQTVQRTRAFGGYTEGHAGDAKLVRACVHKALNKRSTRRLSLPVALTAKHVSSTSRRELFVFVGVAGCALVNPTVSIAAEADDRLGVLQQEAYRAYANQEFQRTVDVLSEIIQLQPASSRWYEMRGQVLVDGKNFQGALHDFDTALSLLPSDSLVERARLYAGRGLAYEGVASWQNALKDYDLALDLAKQAGESPDPYIINSVGNCNNSLGRWQAAREAYLASSQLFQQARGFRGHNGSTTQRLDGAIFSASNAALMLVELGDTQGAITEMQRTARRAPGSADMRAALAALYWADGQQQRAEEQWEWACDQISVGCKKYEDESWLRSVRRWPPRMVALLRDFLELNTHGAAEPAAPSLS